MKENKTKPTDINVDNFLNAIEDDQVREDCFTLTDMMKKISKSEPVMWGDSIIGFGTYHYIYGSGREGDWMVTGFSPRKQNITIYLCYGLHEFGEELEQLGRHKKGSGCLYIRSLTDIDRKILQRILTRTFKIMKDRNFVLTT